MSEKNKGLIGPSSLLFRVGREGIEPPQPKAADLQSAELTTCSTYPYAATATDRDCGLVVGPAADELALEPTMGLEPATGGLQNRCSTN